MIGPECLSLREHWAPVHSSDVAESHRDFFGISSLGVLSWRKATSMFPSGDSMSPTSLVFEAPNAVVEIGVSSGLMVGFHVLFLILPYIYLLEFPEVRGQMIGVSAPLPCGFWELSSGLAACAFPAVSDAPSGCTCPRVPFPLLFILVLFFLLL